MSKDGKLTDERRLLALRQKKNMVMERIKAIDTWLFVTGRTVATRQDQKVKAAFLRERGELVAGMTLLKESIKALDSKVNGQKAKAEVLKGFGSSSKRVTDHALIRWLERKHGINIEEMREVLHQEAMEAIKHGACRKRGDGGLRVTLGDLVYVVHPKIKSVITCYKLGEDDELNG